MKKALVWRAVCFVVTAFLPASAAANGSDYRNEEGSPLVSQVVRPEAGADRLGRELLDEVFGAYSGFTRGRFAELVSDDFTPDGNDFLSRLERRLDGEEVLEVHTYPDAIYYQGEKLVVNFQWEKKTVTRATGKLNLKKGRATLIFVKDGPRMRLYQVRGRDPFNT